MKMRIAVVVLAVLTVAVFAFAGCAPQPTQDTSTDAPASTAEISVSPTPQDSTNISLGESTITVNTTESVKVAPDLAYVYLGVQTKGATAEEAQQENAKVADAVIAAIQKQGVAEEDYETSNINIYEDWETPGRYVMDNTFKVTIRDIDNVGSVIDAAVQAGANSSYSLSFDISNRDEVYIEALSKAMSSVNAKAQTVAEAGGYTIVRPQSITEGGYSSYYDAPMAMEAAAEDSMTSGVSTPVSPGEIEVSASVSGTFVIE